MTEESAKRFALSFLFLGWMMSGFKVKGKSNSGARMEGGRGFPYLNAAQNAA
jgi:hypothetical protein